MENDFKITDEVRMGVLEEIITALTGKPASEIIRRAIITQHKLNKITDSANSLWMVDKPLPPSC